MLICYKTFVDANINNKAKSHYMSKHLNLKFVKLTNHKKTQTLPNLIIFHKIHQTPHFLISSNTCKAF